MPKATKPPAIKWTVFDPPERKRVYTFRGAVIAEFADVIRVEFRESGWHRIETAAGRKVFVHPTSGAVIELDIDEWTR